MTEKHRVVKRGIIPAAAVYGVVWLACFALYWASLATGALDGMVMGYTLLVLYCALPAAGAAAAFLIGRSGALGWWRLAAPCAITAFFVLFVAATFGLSTAFGLTNIASLYPADLVLGFVPSALGLLIGWAAA
ncbi:MAG: hypothetical protein Q4D92_01825 [Slackia sp.]|nr:hypothetical protein [Slackia sp.]